VNPGLNQLRLTAVLAELASLRYTPAGVPALDVQLEHESRQQEAGQDRVVTARVKAIAFGVQAEQLARSSVGSSLRFEGFVATPRNGKHLVFHIQAFSQD
jgi:primosomal replication protein N